MGPALGLLLCWYHEILKGFLWEFVFYKSSSDGIIEHAHEQRRKHNTRVHCLSTPHLYITFAMPRGHRILGNPRRGTKQMESKSYIHK